MSETGELPADKKAFLEPYLPPKARNSTSAPSPQSDAYLQKQGPRSHGTHDGALPFVTLTYASSLDSMIALSPGARTTLSGPETKAMTHYLRLHHDAILVGAGTASVDDPSLNCRYPNSKMVDQPRPVIVDPNARWQVEGGKAYRLAAEGIGKGPWVVTRAHPPTVDPLVQVGGAYIVLSGDTSDLPGSAETADQSLHIAWMSILRELKRRGINSLMIEGGATVINDLLTMPHLVNVVILTIAPTFLGQGGVFVSPSAKITDGNRVNAAWLSDTGWRQFGNDVVLCGRLQDD